MCYIVKEKFTRWEQEWATVETQSSKWYSWSDKYDTDIPDKRFFGKFCYGSSSGKNVSAEKIRLYAGIHFSKRVTAVNKKDWGKEQMFLKPFSNIWQVGSARCLEYMANGGGGGKVIRKNCKVI